MFAGHVGAGLAVARLERRVNVSAFVLAALLLDVVLWLLILAGAEAVAIPPDFASTHQARFVFPYSHGLLAGIGWSLLAGTIALAACRGFDGRARAAGLVALAVFSHWVLDALVHRPELPLLGEHSGKVGVGLWNELPIALTVEAIMLVGGLWLFLAGADLSRPRRLGVAALGLCTLALTVVGMTVGPAPPSAAAMAGSSLATIGVVCALLAWTGGQQAADRA